LQFLRKRLARQIERSFRRLDRQLQKRAEYRARAGFLIFVVHAEGRQRQGIFFVLFIHVERRGVGRFTRKADAHAGRSVVLVDGVRSGAVRPIRQRRSRSGGRLGLRLEGLVDLQKQLIGVLRVGKLFPV